jgi:peptidoglycan/xylan/chitin deacetylase (PgdA/CDA1 family)
LLVLQPVSGAQALVDNQPEPGCPDLGVEAQPADGEPPIVPRVEGPQGVVALTFDAGADRGYAEDILDTLADAEIPATFGITGRWALASPDLVERMAADGHMVINHTFDHRSFTGRSDRLGGLSPDGRQTEIEQADEIIAPLIGHTTCPWYRLPYGDGDARVVGQMAEIGYTQQVGWTVDTFGWRGARTQDIIYRALLLARPNAVYVMHVGIPSRDALALPSIIEGLRARGYGFATVAALD